LLTGGAAGGGMGFAIYRDATKIYTHGYAQSSGYLGSYYSGSGNALVGISMTYLDSPATTSAVTYRLYMGAYAFEAYLNYKGASTEDGTGSTITLMEIAN
jgi:hypothetical protein